MKHFYFKTFVLFVVTSFILSCSTDNGEDEGVNDTTNIKQEKCLAYNKSISPDTIVINSENDLQKLLDYKIAHREENLFKNGWEKVDKMQDSRLSISVKVDTVYVSCYSVDDFADPSVYDNFYAKFGQEMVDEINAVIRPEWRISTSKIYVCQWHLFSAVYQLADDEKPAVRNSPRCALKPSTRDGFTERGYSGYIHQPSRQFQMSSYQLYIKYEKKSNPTFIDVEWPLYVPNPNGYGHIGYEFIYAISKPIK